MKHLVPLLALLLALIGCAQLPRVYPGPAAVTSISRDCTDLFPQGRWQLLHAIEATVPGGKKHLLTGVSVLSSRERSINWALMTTEGFVLFSGRYDGKLTIDRAIPPFDRPGFGQGLMDDLKALFFAPRAPLITAGHLKSGEQVCRYASLEMTSDIVIGPDGTWTEHQYSVHQRLVRSIRADTIVSEGHSVLARHIVVKDHGMLGYQLELKLLEAIPLDAPARTEE